MHSDTVSNKPGYTAKGQLQERTPNMRLQFLEQEIGRNLEDDIGNEENGQCGIVFGPVQNTQVFLESENRRVTDIDTGQSQRTARI